MINIHNKNELNKLWTSFLEDDTQAFILLHYSEEVNKELNSISLLRFEYFATTDAFRLTVNIHEENYVIHMNRAFLMVSRMGEETHVFPLYRVFPGLTKNEVYNIHETLNRFKEFSLNYFEKSYA